ncbi:Golgin candidate 6 [Camellia lanceoleosa]|uniref:Golgin candidate 6 n=1 Tax=Camellia lanceoleosa TaxID=1840588 RepID=A0ACC0G4M8_9ERIC|nr:Golgin candidate 6 [Camellia lanceoleosa]
MPYFNSYVERLLDCISNGVLVEDRRTAIAELQFVVAKSRAAQLAFGAMGFSVLLSVLKEERDDVEMVIQNEVLLLLTYLTREAEKIQKILVFEGAFEKSVRKVLLLFSNLGAIQVQGACCLRLLCVNSGVEWCDRWNGGRSSRVEWIFKLITKTERSVYLWPYIQDWCMFYELEQLAETETCSRAASVLSHVLKDNMQCKERVL